MNSHLHQSDSVPIPTRLLSFKETFATAWRAARLVVKQSPVLIGVLAAMPVLVTLALHALGQERLLHYLTPPPSEGFWGMITAGQSGNLGTFSTAMASYIFARRLIVSSPVFDGFRVRPAWLFTLVAMATLFVSMMVSVFGALLFVLPGLYILMVTFFAQDLALFDGTAPFSAMGISRDLLRDEREGKNSRWFGPAFWKATVLVLSAGLTMFLANTLVIALVSYVTRLIGSPFAGAQPLSFFEVGAAIMISALTNAIYIVFLAERLTFGSPKARERLTRIAGVHS